MTSLNPISPPELKRKLDSRAALLIDLRETDEHPREPTLASRFAPLSATTCTQRVRVEWVLSMIRRRLSTNGVESSATSRSWRVMPP